MIDLLTIAGGVALLLFGVRYLRKGLDRLFGARLGAVMNRFASTPVTAAASGLMVAVLAPSSTSISMLAVQTVQAGHMTARRMLAVMLGANIGLTVMVQLIALDFDQYAPIAILGGVILFQFTSAPRSRGVGQVLLSLGFLFLAMRVIRTAVATNGLSESADFIQLVGIAEGYPVVLAAVAGVLTILLQSSTATFGLIIGLTTAGTLTTALVVPLVLGVNIGMSMTTLLFGWRRVDSRRLALGNLLMKLAVAAVVLVVHALVRGRLPDVPPAAMPQLVAGLHTGFNLLVAAAGMPAIGVVSAMLERIVPAPRGEMARTFGPKFIASGPLGGLALAVGQSRREIMHMAEIIRGMLDDVWTAMRTGDDALARAVSERDDRVDELDAAIKQFLTRLVREEIDESIAVEQMMQLRCLAELETIGDIIDKNLCELVLKKIRLRAQFSEEGARELDDLHAKILVNFEMAVTALAGRDRALAQQLFRSRKRLRDLERELRDRHFQRLNAGMTETHETSAIHLDLLTHLERINGALGHMAYAITIDSSDG